MNAGTLPERLRRGTRRFALYTLQTLTAIVLAAVLPLRLVRKSFVRTPTRSVWTGAPIITLSLKARCEAMLGVRARSLVTSTFYITEAFDYNLSQWRAIPVLGRLISYGAFLWVCVMADRVHAFCDGALLPPIYRSTFNFFELLVYRLLGIQVFVWSYGADVRSREITLGLGEPNCCTDCTLVGKACICDETLRTANMAQLARHARAIFAMGDMPAYTPRSRNHLFYWPVDLTADGGRRYTPAYPMPEPGRPVRIVHAPNHRMFKGTRFLEAAVAALAKDGVPVELVLVEGVPNDQALAIYRTADIVFDQCLIGFHGYFALESMALGKPVMCFIRKPKEYLLAPDECPIINVHASTLREDIRRAVENRAQLAELGRRSRQYVAKHYSLDAFAGRLAGAYVDLGVTP